MPRIPKPPEPPPPPEDSPDESREEKFCRLANRRVNHILHHTRVLGNLANRNNYSYSEDQISRIFEVIDGSVSEVKALFTRGRRPDFHL